MLCCFLFAWRADELALPDQLFYNTGISNYFWVLTNRKRPERHPEFRLDAGGGSRTPAPFRGDQT